MPVLYEEVPVRRLLTGGTLGRKAPLAFITLTFEYGREFHGMRVLTAQGETNEFIKPVLRYYDYRNVVKVGRPKLASVEVCHSGIRLFDS